MSICSKEGRKAPIIFKEIIPKYFLNFVKNYNRFKEHKNFEKRYTQKNKRQTNHKKLE